MREAFHLVPNREGTATLPDGTRIYIEYENKLDTDGFGETEIHESEHAVVAIKNGTAVIEASVIPEGNSLGHVQLASYDPVAGASSHRRSGNGHDRMLVEAGGHHFESLGKIADGIVSRNKKGVRAVASALAKKGRLSGGEIRRILDKAGAGERILIRIVTPDGKEKTLRKEARKTQHLEIPVESPGARKPANENEKNSPLPKAA